MHRSWILSTVILAGCASYQAKPLDPAQLAQRFEERSLTSAALRSYLEQQLGRPVRSWPLQQWDRKRLTAAAGFYSPALALARAQQATAKAGIAVAGARPNPVLQFPFEYINNHDGSGRPYTTGPAFDIPLRTAGKRADLIDHATYLAEAAHLDTLNAAWKVRSLVRDAMLGILIATKRAALLSGKVALQQQIVDMLHRRLVLGETARPDAGRTQLLLIQAQTSLAAEQRALLDARAHLAATVGVPIGALNAIQLDFEDVEHAVIAPSPAEARYAAVFHRADLLSALAAYEASQAALQLEVARQYPDIHIGAGYTYDAGANKISLGLAGVTLPLLDRNQGAIAQAEAKRTEMAARALALQATILNDLDHALIRYRQSRAALDLAASQLAATAKQLGSQKAGLAAGLVGRLELTQARSDYQTIAAEYLNAVAAAQQAAGLLEDAMQQPMQATTESLLLPLQKSAQ